MISSATHFIEFVELLGLRALLQQQDEEEDGGGDREVGKPLGK